VTENAPDATIVFDHFHVVKLMNDAIDGIRRTQYALEKDLNKRDVLKGTRWLLLMNGKDVMDDQYRTRLDNALSMNKPLSQAYYLKESLREIWAQTNKDKAEQVLLDWVEQARSSGQKQLITMANTIMAHRTGILAWYDGYLSTARLEGINNKIKVLKRVAYGYRDEEYFKLRLFALHDNRITRKSRMNLYYLGTLLEVLSCVIWVAHSSAPDFLYNIVPRACARGYFWVTALQFPPSLHIR